MWNTADQDWEPTEADIRASWAAEQTIGNGGSRQLIRSLDNTGWGYKILKPNDPFGDTQAATTLRYATYWENNQNTREWKQHQRSFTWPTGIRVPPMKPLLHLPRPARKNELEPPFGPVLPVKIIKGETPHALGDDCNCQNVTGRAWDGCYKQHLMALPGIIEYDECVITGGYLYILDAA